MGPVLIPAQENYDRRTTLNPTFELAYWDWGLNTAQRWRERLGLARNPEWDRVLKHLSKPTVKEGVYAAIGRRRSPNARIIRPCWRPWRSTALTVDRSQHNEPQLDNVQKTWDWPRTWGWDYPMMAMTAARVGKPEEAIDALLLDTPKNHYLANGHNFQRGNLQLYLPGNGGLLTAVAMMAAGWDGAPKRSAPGFPNNGRWKVQWEGLTPMP